MTAFPTATLELHHVQFIVRALWDLARTDGVHDTEQVMLRGFYEQCREEVHGLSSFEDVIAAPFDAAAAAELFDTDALKATLLESCVFLAYADGGYSAGERAKVGAYAKALGVPAEALATLEDAVGDHLLQQVALVENTDALQKVAAGIAAGG